MKRFTWRGLALTVAMLGAACGAPTDIRHQQEEGTCPASPMAELRGRLASGAECTSAADCLPTCCSCNAPSTKEYLKAACVEGRCIGAATCLGDEARDYCKQEG